MLPTTTAYKDTLRELNDKKMDIREDFYTTVPMTNRKWTETNYQLRHVINSIAVHGFHFKFCSEARFHEPSDECRCKLCSAQCGPYHMTTDHLVSYDRVHCQNVLHDRTSYGTQIINMVRNNYMPCDGVCLLAQTVLPTRFSIAKV